MAGAAAKLFVDRKLKQRKVVLFSKARDPACRRVKALLEQYDFLNHPEYEFVDIESRQDVTQIENYFQIICLSDRREVPRLFANEKYIGGEFEINLKHESGELPILLRKAADSTMHLLQSSSTSVVVE